MRSGDMVPLVVYLAGVPWDGCEGTDRRLVSALAADARVLWVDPPTSSLRRKARGGFVRQASKLERVAHHVDRLQVAGPPLVTRPVVHSVANALLGTRLRAAVADSGGADAVVLANPLMRFPRSVGGRRLYYVTDDWLAGAELMGLSRQAIERFQQANVREADAVAAVSPPLADRLSQAHGRAVAVLANGCTVDDRSDLAAVDLGLPAPVIGLTGQVNERLDLEILGAVADRGLSLAVVGARKERTREFSEAFDRLAGRSNVRWYGHQPASSLPGFLASFDVGITPYAISAFNTASFPIKTLDYLAAGLPCVASPLPALDWLSTHLIDVAATPQHFADLVEQAATAPADKDAVAQRIAFARRHSWGARAAQLLASLGVPARPEAGPPPPFIAIYKTRGMP